MRIDNAIAIFICINMYAYILMHIDFIIIVFYTHEILARHVKEIAIKPKCYLNIEKIYTRRSRTNIYTFV